MPTSFPTLLYLPSDAYNVQQNQVNGRRIAGKLLLQGLVADLQPAESLHLIAPGSHQRAELSSLIQAVLPEQATVQLHSAVNPTVCRDIGMVFRPDPGIAQWSYWRAGQAPNAFSMTGIIHTLCSDVVLRSLAELATAPVHPWDALICTSTAGRDVVRAVLEHALERLALRFQIPALSPETNLPQLPVIPLAVDDRQPYRPELSRAQRRAAARHDLGIDQNEFVLAYVGRLSFHSKAHPLILYRVIDRLRAAGYPIRLLECGHLINQPISEAYRDARALYPHVLIQEVGGLCPATEEEKWQVLAAADAFVSLSDSIQETFGISLLEAMAAELPVIATDWDGYKDLVDPGVTGRLVPCLDVLPGCTDNDLVGALYSLGLSDYESMLALRSLVVVVDENVLEAVILDLIEQPEQRATMGTAGLRRLQHRFSWSVVAGQFRDLATDLADRRQSAEGVHVRQSAEFDFARYFAGYASGDFTASTVVLAPGASPQLAGLQMTGPLLDRCPGVRAGELAAMLFSAGSLSRSDIESQGVTADVATLVLAALVKFGLAVPVEE